MLQNNNNIEYVTNLVYNFKNLPIKKKLEAAPVLAEKSRNLADGKALKTFDVDILKRQQEPYDECKDLFGYGVNRTLS